ncbi:MerR family transcriptional regulator [Lachnospira pectinoschiza]|uniref:DNA-binding transcriptional regulator, MerR family n=1 Tax=Lachnospira pectinoschiza TaxID=28052 RepID=A0A1H0A315_9FIRM|nr:MerR family transcriptional regulator [Lachnospira pectinoschiza]SDN27654.1 DNA-binding transcriptional regulator, MerR family [Lachnospira pectinoschiza]
MYYTVGEIANLLHIAPSTLRYYDKEGLLPFVNRSGGGIRVFEEKDFEWLYTIECLKKTGMPIKDIKPFIDWCMEGDSTISQRKVLIERQRQVMLEKMKKMQETLDMLTYKKWYYEVAEEAGTCKVPDEMADEDVPAELLAARKRSKNAPEEK